MRATSGRNFPADYFLEETSLKLTRLVAGTADGLAECRAIEIFAQIHKREKRVEDARFHFVWQVQSAGGGSSQQLSARADVLDYFDLAFVRRATEHGFATHFGADLLHALSEVQDALLLRL
jgi:hypothetical protein